MRNRIVVTLTLLFLLAAVPVSAADTAPAPAKVGSRAEQFRILHAKMQRSPGRSWPQLQIEYRTANEDKRADIQQKWKDLVAEGQKIEPKLIEAAQESLSGSPQRRQGDCQVPGQAARRGRARPTTTSPRRKSASC